MLPRLVEMEAKHGSLTRGMLAGMAARKGASSQSNEAPLPPKPLFTTLRSGLQQMVNSLLVRLDGTRLHLQTPVSSVTKEGGRWRVTVGEVSAVFDAVVIATPAWAAANLLNGTDSEISSVLGEIPYSSSVTMNLVYDGNDLDPLPEGFGFLVPAVEKRAMLACTFLHRKFPGRTAPGKSVLRAFLGGTHNALLLSQTDEELAGLVRRELMEILHISAAPEMIEVQRWPRAMAQYSVGHQDRQKRIKERLSVLPGLHLVGNAYDGIGISDCIRLGRSAARTLAGQAEEVAAQLI